MNPTKVRMWFYGIVAAGLTTYVVYATWMPGSSYTGTPPKLSSEEAAARQRLREHVRMLATAIGPRNVDHPERFDEARDYLKNELEALTNPQTQQVKLEELERAGDGAKNIIFEIPGALGSEVVVVGAHYDSCNESPGANDNGSGVAVGTSRILSDIRGLLVCCIRRAATSLRS